jgi:ribonuclease D
MRVREAAARPSMDADPGTVDAIAELARASGVLGIDTEFMSEGRYRALLCLVQVAVPDPDAEGGARVVLLDPLKGAGADDPAQGPSVTHGGFDPGPLADVLADPEVEIVLHAGRQDIAILRRAWRTQVRNVFDTQIAAGFAGFAAQAGYGNLLADALGVRLAKTAGFTRWDLRPLTAEQVSYARDDVVHLLPLAEDLRRRLTKTGRLGWARQECRRLEEATDERDPDAAWERLPRVHQLSARARAVAKELAAWRERAAASEDRPIGSVLADAPLLELARRQPTTIGSLDRIRGLQPSAQRRRGEELLAAVRRGMAGPPLTLQAQDRPDIRPQDAPLIALGESLARARALAAGLAYELVASRADLEQIVSAVRRGDSEPNVRTLQGWRRDLVGAELLDLLAGRLLLGADGNGGLLTHQPEQIQAPSGAD